MRRNINERIPYPVSGWPSFELIPLAILSKLSKLTKQRPAGSETDFGTNKISLKQVFG